jgi:2-methylisocitrate lyase-like PEP mutase family enzyme
VNDQKASAEAFRELHRTARPLLLVNAWDVVSARILEDLGAQAIATTSAGVAWAEGYADGEQISREHMLARVARITRAVDVPVSADLEGAYGETVADAHATARGAIESGAVGLNVEDARRGARALLAVEAQADRIKAMRETAVQLGVPLVINARTDVFLASIGDDDRWRLAEALRRGNQYLGAGADCVFVPGVTDRETIQALVAGVRGPLNILAGATTPPMAELQAMGVARVSLGSGAMGVVLAEFRDLVRRLADTGDFSFLSRRMQHNDINAMLDRHRSGSA